MIYFLQSSMGSFHESHGGPGRSDNARQDQLSKKSWEERKATAADMERVALKAVINLVEVS